MVLRNTLLQRHTTEQPILNPLVSTHTPIDESNIEQAEEMSLFQQVPSAKTEVSRDGNALVVHRFDVDEQGHALWGMEDFCALLGLRPAMKYETTWERIARAVRDNVPGSHQYETFRRLAATTLLLTYALRNADCHALLYTAWGDVHLSPAYDFLTTSVYASYQYNPPGIGFMGKKTWTPGNTLPRFIASTFGIPLREQALLLDAIGDAVSEVVHWFRRRWRSTPTSGTSGSGCCLLGKKNGLRDKRVYASGDWPGDKVFEGISDAPKLANPSTAVGRSPLMGNRSRRSKK